mgnify:CR=1 FL=1
MHLLDPFGIILKSLRCIGSGCGGFLDIWEDSSRDDGYSHRITLRGALRKTDLGRPRDSKVYVLPKIQYCVFAKSLYSALRCLWDCLKRVFWTVFGTPQSIAMGRPKDTANFVWESQKIQPVSLGEPKDARIYKYPNYRSGQPKDTTDTVLEQTLDLNDIAIVQRLQLPLSKDAKRCKVPTPNSKLTKTLEVPRTTSIPIKLFGGS